MEYNSTTQKGSQKQKEPDNCKEIGFHKLLMCPYYESLLVLYANFTNLSEQFESFKKRCFLEQNGPDVVCMSISNGSDSFPNLNKEKYQYNLFFRYEEQTLETDIPNKSVAMYIKSNISCRKHENLIRLKLTSCTHFWINILNSRNRKIVLGVVFCHSSMTEETKKQFNSILKKLESEEQTVYILGNIYPLSDDELNFKSLITNQDKIKETLCQIYTNDQSSKEFKRETVQVTGFSNCRPTYCFIP